MLPVVGVGRLAHTHTHTITRRHTKVANMKVIAWARRVHTSSLFNGRGIGQHDDHEVCACAGDHMHMMDTYIVCSHFRSGQQPLGERVQHE